MTTTTVETASSVLPATRARPSLWRMPLDRGSTVLALSVMVLNLVDAFGTLRHVAHGAEEVNPLMGQLLQAGPVAFVAGKHLIACAGIMGVLAHSRHRAARLALKWGLFPIYLAIAAYQLILFALIP